MRIIAEAGVNHNGQVELAKELIRAAARADADAIKFQTFTPELVATGTAPKAVYQRVTTSTDETQLEMIRALQLPLDCYQDLLSLADTEGLQFLSTPFDQPSLQFLVHELGLKEIKIPSGEVTNLPFLVQVGRTGARVILSTGMSDLAEIGTALDALSYGACEAVEPGAASDFEGFRRTNEGFQWLVRNVELLHCTTEYPAPLEDINLRAMATMVDQFGLPVGLSDHSKGVNVAIAAAALGACTLEKHLTLSRQMAGPDHTASVEPDEFAQLVIGVREVENALGSPVKQVTPSELANRDLVRRGLVAARDLPAGHALGPGDLIAIRPENSHKPKEYWDLLGARTKKSIERGGSIVVDGGGQA